jgi:hypothetical protein|tara:strand:+ start:205 stop:540 length:336 start_codon:yes stop_codon:yes gene_type:complete
VPTVPIERCLNPIDVVPFQESKAKIAFFVQQELFVIETHVNELICTEHYSTGDRMILAVPTLQDDLVVINKEIVAGHSIHVLILCEKRREHSDELSIDIVIRVNSHSKQRT